MCDEKSLFASKYVQSKKQKQKHQKSGSGGGKNKQHQHQPIHPTPVTLASNYGFYADEPSSDDDDEDTSDHSCAPDFNQLVNSSITNVGGHFYFADEKKSMAAQAAANKDESALKSSLFYIDGKLLQKALATIPFYERMEYDVEHFTAEEIENQEKEAAKHEDAYRDSCENRGRDMIIHRIRGKSAKKLPEINKKVTIEDPMTSDSTRDELDDILDGNKAFSIVHEPVPRNTPVHLEAESKDNMQKWLDNLLN